MPAAEHKLDLDLPAVAHTRPTGRETLTGSGPRYRVKDPSRPSRTAKWALRDGSMTRLAVAYGGN